MIVYLLLSIYLFFVFGHSLYVAIMGYKHKRDSVGLHWLEKFNLYTIVLPFALVWDFGMSLIVSAICLRKPSWTLTKTLKRFKNEETGWRQKFAFWICETLLNTYDKNHC